MLHYETNIPPLIEGVGEKTERGGFGGMNHHTTNTLDYRDFVLQEYALLITGSKQ